MHPNEKTLQAFAEHKDLTNVKRYNTTSELFDAWDNLTANATSLRAKRSNPELNDVKHD